MKLNKLLSWIPTLDDNDLLQESYEDIIKKISLFPALLPVRLDTVGCSKGLIMPAKYSDTESEIAIKEITDYIGISFIQDINLSGTKTNLEIGDITKSDYGFSDYTSLVKNIPEYPTIYKSRDIFYSENENPLLFLIQAYVYPYPFVVFNGASEKTPFNIKHTYNISEMRSLYSDSDLEVDNTLLYFWITKAMAINKLSEGDISTATRLDALSAQYINIYNKNTNWIKRSVPAVTTNNKRYNL